jgi:CubicO group peptidase (beta-lactamase class C family)
MWAAHLPDTDPLERSPLRHSPIALALSLIAGGLSLPSWAAEPAYPHANEPIGTVEQIYDGAMLPDLAVSTYRNIDRLFPTHTIKAGGHPYPLPNADKQLGNVKFTQDGKKYDLYDFVALDGITAMLVIKDGKIVYETYQRGNTEKTRWMSMSMAKSITSTLAAVAIKDGLIKGLDAQVVDYVPKLKGSAYDGVTLRNVLMMSSGVKWNETYTDPKSDRRALLNAQISQKPGSAVELMSKLPKAAEPGTVNNYSTGETQILGEVVRGAVKMPLADYLSQKIWAPFGMESDANWWLDSPDGVEIGGSGISATLRDYGRFGLFFLNNGAIYGQSILPEGWVKEATTPKELKGGKPLDYGYMWWTAWTEASVKDGAFAAVGIQGQNIYVNPANNVVIVTFGAQPKPVEKEPVDPMVFFDAVVAALK